MDKALQTGDKRTACTCTDEDDIAKAASCQHTPARRTSGRSQPQPGSRRDSDTATATTTATTETGRRKCTCGVKDPEKPCRRKRHPPLTSPQTSKEKKCQDTCRGLTHDSKVSSPEQQQQQQQDRDTEKPTDDVDALIRTSSRTSSRGSKGRQRSSASKSADREAAAPRSPLSPTPSRRSASSERITSPQAKRPLSASASRTSREGGPLPYDTQSGDALPISPGRQQQQPQGQVPNDDLPSTKADASGEMFYSAASEPPIASPRDGKQAKTGSKDDTETTSPAQGSLAESATPQPGAETGPVDADGAKLISCPSQASKSMGTATPGALSTPGSRTKSQCPEECPLQKQLQDDINQQDAKSGKRTPKTPDSGTIGKTGSDTGSATGGGHRTKGSAKSTPTTSFKDATMAGASCKGKPGTERAGENPLSCKGKPPGRESCAGRSPTPSELAALLRKGLLDKGSDATNKLNQWADMLMHPYTWKLFKAILFFLIGLKICSEAWYMLIPIRGWGVAISKCPCQCSN